MRFMTDGLIMILGYSHSVAVAFLAVSMLMMRTLDGRYPPAPDPQSQLSFLRVYRMVGTVAKISLFWAIVAGLLRAVYHSDYERLAAWGELQTAVAVAVHAGILLLVAAGVFLWIRFSAKVKRLKCGGAVR